MTPGALFEIRSDRAPQGIGRRGRSLFMQVKAQVNPHPVGLYSLQLGLPLVVMRRGGCGVCLEGYCRVDLSGDLWGENPLY
jgi:hypothetical protein